MIFVALFQWLLVVLATVILAAPAQALVWKRSATRWWQHVPLASAIGYCITFIFEYWNHVSLGNLSIGSQTYVRDGTLTSAGWWEVADQALTGLVTGAIVGFLVWLLLRALEARNAAQAHAGTGAERRRSGRR